MKDSLVIGIDIGGSHITAAAIQLQSSLLMTNTRFNAHYDGNQSAEAILQDWAKVINKTIQTVDAKKIMGLSFAIPGAFDYCNGIAKYQNIGKLDALFDVHIPFALRPFLAYEGDLEMRFVNDAAAFGMGEAAFGASKNHQRAVAITLGTGFGSTFLANGLPVNNGNHVPPEGCLWHLPFKNSIADDYISTRWFEKTFFAKYRQQVKGVKDIANMARELGLGRELFKSFGANLAMILTPWLNRFNSEVLVIGGQLVKAYDLFGSELEEGFLMEGLNVSIKHSELMVDSAILGSALLYHEAFWYRIKEATPAI